MKIVFFANNWLGREVLRWIREQGQAIEALVVHPPSRQKYLSEIIELSGCPEERVFDGSTLRQPEVRERLISLKADLGISVLFDYLIRPKILNSFRLGVINLHPAYLPFNRGNYPNVWSIVDGSPAGVTLHYMDQTLDTGDIIAQHKTEVLSWDTGETLYRRLEQDALSLFKLHFESIVEERAVRRPQDRSQGTTHQRKDVDAVDRIDLDALVRAGDLIDRIRARTFAGYRGAFFEDRGRRVWVSIKLEPDERLPSTTSTDPVPGGKRKI
ncbi:MAG: formyltransferase family protein [Pseudomonadota bacterium]